MDAVALSDAWKLYGIKMGVPNSPGPPEKGKGKRSANVVQNAKRKELTDRMNVIQSIMKDRLAYIEERYANHLERAGVFEGFIKKTKPKYNKNQE